MVAIDEPVRIRVQRLADQFLGDVRAVGVRGVDEVDAELDEAAQHADAFVGVGRRAPDALARQAHRAESEAVDGEVAADGEGGHVQQPYADDDKVALVKLSDLAALPLTYSEVGATAGPLPAGYHHVQKSAVIGRGRQRFEDAAAAGMRWGMLRGAGVRVEATTEVAAVGSEVIVHLGPVRAPCRVVYVVDEPDRRGIRLRHAARPRRIRRGAVPRPLRPGHRGGVSRRWRRSPGTRRGGAGWARRSRR